MPRRLCRGKAVPAILRRRHVFNPAGKFVTELIRLGLIPTLNPHSGGLYQYGLTVIDAVTRGWARDERRGVAVLGDPVELKQAEASLPGSWERISLSPRWDPRRFAHPLRRVGMAEPVAWVVRHLSRGRVLWRSGVGRRQAGWDRRHGLDATLWTTARREIARFDQPMAVAFHDIQHRLHSRFPEFSAGARGAAIENQLRMAASRATTAIVESETGMEDLLDAYGDVLRRERIRILPYPPPPHISADDPDAQIRAVRRRHRLPERYLFYPAQFWQHKNHATVVRALALLLARRSIIPPLVLCGSRRGQLRKRTFEDAMALATRLGVRRQLVVLDYVPDSDMGGLYLGAAALVMPTFVGPSNIPILEAWVTGCPVITSDIRGVRDQAGDAALLVDPSSEEQLAMAIELLWTDTEAAARLARAGRARVRTFSREAFAESLSTVISDTLAHGRQS
jgi:glycosyltransferase involved in cell wall biosynthesis